MAPVALALLVISVIKDKGKSEGKVLLVIWSVVMIALMLNQRRYAYYAVINMGLLSAYLVYIVTKHFAQVQVESKTDKHKTISSSNPSERGGVYTDCPRCFVCPT